ncbi:MAG: hypothetical protein Q8K04_13145 [Lutibacter sp.]|nr:hypothetical protein [Lutibacter sp.]
MKITRTCIFPKDVQCITGRSERSGRRLLHEIRIDFGKDSHQYLTSEEFSEYSGININVVNEYLQKVS